MTLEEALSTESSSEMNIIDDEIRFHFTSSNKVYTTLNLPFFVIAIKDLQCIAGEKDYKITRRWAFHIIIIHHHPQFTAIYRYTLKHHLRIIHWDSKTLLTRLLTEPPLYTFPPWLYRFYHSLLALWAKWKYLNRNCATGWNGWMDGGG